MIYTCWAPVVNVNLIITEKVIIVLYNALDETYPK